MPACPRTVLFALSFAAAVCGQDTVVGVPPIERAIDDLADPSRARPAADALVRLGDAALAQLAAVVTVPQRYVEPRPRVLGALYVLGRLGPAALPVLPRIVAAIDDRDWGVADQALWALAEVGQYGTVEQRVEWVASIRDQHFVARVSRQRLLLAIEPALDDLRRGLCADDPALVTAACLQVRAGQWPAPRVRDELRACLHRQLDVALQPLVVPWDAGPMRAAASALAAAWLALDGGSATAAALAVAPHAEGESVDGNSLLLGRGLLRHYDPALRRRALPLLAGLGGAGLTERAELLPLLVDGDAELRQLAVWTVLGLGRNGLLALPLLRRLQREDGDIGVRMACSSVADDLLRSCAAGDEVALLAAIDERLQGADRSPPPLPTEPRLLELLTQIWCGAEWTEAAMARRLVPEPRRGMPLPPPLCRAVLRYGINVEPELRAFAAAWFVRHGRDAVGIGLEQELDRMAAMTGSEDPALVEMLAWVRAGEDASEAELRVALLHHNPRVVVRAAVQWLRRGDATAPLDRDAVRQLARLEVDGAGGPMPEVGGRPAPRWWLLGFDLGDDVAAAVALLLLAAGEPEVDLGVLRLLAPPGGDATDWVRDQVAARAFAALATRLETQMRERLNLPDGRTWR